MSTKKLSLTGQILIGLVLGIVVGICLTDNPDLATTYIKPFGSLFLNLIKFIVVPIVLFSIAGGIISMQDIRKVGSVGGKTIVYYLTTTALATSIGLVLANLMKGLFTPLETTGLVYEPPKATSFIDTVINVFPSNAVAPLAESNMLQIIVISIFFGFGTILAKEKGAVMERFIESANAVSMQVMRLVIALSPYAVFCLLVPVVAKNGPAILGSLAAALAVAYTAYIVHALVVYSLSVKLLAHLSPLAFFKGMLPAMTLAFSSASSVGTLPLNMQCAGELGGRRDVVSFVLPLGATINMDGTAIYQGVCSVFIATCFGIELTFVQMLTIVGMATLASVGTAGVPGSGVIMLAMVLQSVGLPVEGIALVLGVDRLFDMGRTTVNITGDTACALVVSALENRKSAK